MMPLKPRRTAPIDKAVPRHGERLRLGLTGLGAIFLIVILVAAGLKPAAAPAVGDPQGESLAVLGVAPGAPAPVATPQP
jgi:hypothetical protein